MSRWSGPVDSNTTWIVKMEPRWRSHFSAFCGQPLHPYVHSSSFHDITPALTSVLL